MNKEFYQVDTIKDLFEAILDEKYISYSNNPEYKFKLEDNKLIGVDGSELMEIDLFRLENFYIWD